MKKTLISTLILLASITSQVKSHFVRVAVYENKKTGQLILVLGDIHLPLEKGAAKKQHDQLIEKLKKLYKKTNITFVEDPTNDTVHKDHNRYQAAIKFINSKIKKTDLENQTPLAFLHSDLKENLNVENIECRYMKLNFINESELGSFDASNSTIPNITLNDVLDEIKQNIKNQKQQEIEISKYKDNYSPEEYQKIVEFFQKTIESGQKSLEELIKSIEEMSQLQNKSHDELVIEVQTLLKNMLCSDSYVDTKTEKYMKYIEKISCDLQKKSANELINIIEHITLTKNITNDAHILDTNIVYNIIKNSDKNNNKKIIVICAGLAHTSKVEEFLNYSENYKIINGWGSETINYDYSNLEKCNKEMTKFLKSSWLLPIDIAELFRTLFCNNTYRMCCKAPSCFDNMSTENLTKLHEKILNIQQEFDQKSHSEEEIEKRRLENDTISKTNIDFYIEEFKNTQDCLNTKLDNILNELMHNLEKIKYLSTITTEYESHYSKKEFMEINICLYTLSLQINKFIKEEWNTLSEKVIYTDHLNTLDKINGKISQLNQKVSNIEKSIENFRIQYVDSIFNFKFQMPQENRSVYENKPIKLFDICDKDEKLGLKKNLAEDVGNIARKLKNFFQYDPESTSKTVVVN